ncbi:MAG TPA: hypothetical protein VF020_01965 [Chthoniobacterales bacterium]
MSQDQLDRIEDTLNNLRDDLAVLIALNPSDVVQLASNIVVNEAYSDKDFQDMCRKFLGRHTKRVRSEN